MPICFTAERLTALEVEDLTGADHGKTSPARITPPQRRPRAELRDARRSGSAEDPEAPGSGHLADRIRIWCLRLSRNPRLWNTRWRRPVFPINTPHAQDG